MDYATKAKKMAIAPLFLILFIPLMILIAFIGYSYGGNDSALYVVGFIMAIFAGLLGGIIPLIFSIISLINSLKAIRNSQHAKVKYVFIAISEFIIGLLWIYAAFHVFEQSMSV